MSTFQTIIERHARVANAVGIDPSGSNGLELIKGKVQAHGRLDQDGLQTCLDQFRPVGGWLQYQGQIVRPQDFDFADGVPSEHPDWGLLLDAELFGPGDQPASLSIRFDGEHWLATEWQPGSGEEFLCEPVERRGLGGIRLEYIRLWHEQNKELRTTSAWLVGLGAKDEGEQE